MGVVPFPVRLLQADLLFHFHSHTRLNKGTLNKGTAEEGVLSTSTEHLTGDHVLDVKTLLTTDPKETLQCLPVTSCSVDTFTTNPLPSSPCPLLLPFFSATSLCWSKGFLKWLWKKQSDITSKSTTLASPGAMSTPSLELILQVSMEEHESIDQCPESRENRISSVSRLYSMNCTKLRQNSWKQEPTSGATHTYFSVSYSQLPCPSCWPYSWAETLNSKTCLPIRYHSAKVMHCPAGDSFSAVKSLAIWLWQKEGKTKEQMDRFNCYTGQVHHQFQVM